MELDTLCRMTEHFTVQTAAQKRVIYIWQLVPQLNLNQNVKGDGTLSTMLMALPFFFSINIKLSPVDDLYLPSHTLNFCTTTFKFLQHIGILGELRNQTTLCLLQSLKGAKMSKFDTVVIDSAFYNPILAFYFKMASTG
jgi:hypothetical protein